MSCMHQIRSLTQTSRESSRAARTWRKCSGNSTIMITKLFLFWLSVARLSLEQIFSHFDLYDAIHVLFLGAIGICLRFLQLGSWDASKKVRSSLRSPSATSGSKKRGSVSFAAGTKFYPIQTYSPVGKALFDCR